MPMIDETTYAVVKSAKTVKFVDYAKEYLEINRKIDELNSRKKAIGDYFMRAFEGKDFKTFKIEEDQIGITRCDGSVKVSFDYKKLYTDHPELTDTLDPYKSSKKTAGYVKIYNFVENKAKTYDDIASAVAALR